MRDIDLLILSDRYLPYSVGGAELSLHSVVRRIPKYKNILVCSVYPNDYDEDNQFYAYENVDIFQLEPYANFPFQYLTMSQYQYLDRNNNAYLKSCERLMLKDYFEKYVLYDSLTDEDQKFLLKTGIDEITFGSNASLDVMRDFFKEINIKVLHADNLRSIALSQAIKADKKIFTIRDNRFHEAGIKDGLSDFQINILIGNFEYRLSLLDKADVVTVTSSFLLENLKRVKPEINYLKIPNPIDDLNLVKTYISSDLPLMDGFNIVIIGMLNENKGQVQFIKALKKQIKDHPDIKIHFLGRGDRIKRRIIEISQESGIASQVLLHDYLSREEVYKFLVAAQLVVLPTMWDEPFGRVPLEAGLVKKVVVSFAVGGLNESIIDGKTGFLIKKGDYQAMFEKILFLKRFTEKRLHMGLEAYQHVIKTYDLDDISRAYFDVWNFGGK